MRLLFEEENVTVHGKAVPETGQISIVEMDNPFKRELIWDPVAAGDWTFLGPSEYDSGFRIDLSQIARLNRPRSDQNGLRYLVIKLRDGATLPSLHFAPGGVERTCDCLRSYFKFNENLTNPGELIVEALRPPEQTGFGIWGDEDENRGNKHTKKDLVHQTFGIFSKITKAIENLVEEKDPVLQRHIRANEEVLRYPALGRAELPEIIRAEPLTLEDFNALIATKADKELKIKIFNGGLTPEARPTVWQHIFGVYNDEHLHTDRRDAYDKLRSQWEALTPEQEQYCSLFRERRALIGKDVIRTEPTRLTEDEINRLSVLLTTYAVYDQDIGYVQGMSDIGVVILDLFEQDHVAFWVFTKFMHRIRGNFEKSQKAMKLQFQALRILLAFTDREMLQFFDDRDTGHMFFTFPWLLIIFRRLCSWEQLPQLWDCWLTAPCSNFHLLFAIAVLDCYRDQIMMPDNGYSEILQFVNRLNGQIDLDQTITHAQSLLAKMRDSISTPPAVKQLLGL